MKPEVSPTCGSAGLAGGVLACLDGCRRACSGDDSSSEPPGTITRYDIDPNFPPIALAAAPDGSVWYVEDPGTTIVHLTLDGSVSRTELSDIAGE
ncbi:MAG: hypothetical protein H6512_01475 [Acidimicrobiia bacterium]|nr:hypothetical protein [Acidimicrobiia bacterium]